MTSGRALLTLENVSVRFGRQEVLKSISLEISEGESFVLIGPSGQGKSVLLKTLAGLITPTSGRVLWGGDDIAQMDSDKRLRWMRSMGMLFQKNALFDSLSVAQNVAFPINETTDIPQNEVQKRVDRFLRAVEIDHAAALFPHEISGGMQKRLGIARALGLEPTIIFYDDPTAGLDPITSRKIIQLILSLRSEMKSTICTITNDMNRAYQLAGRIGMVVDGELLITGGRQETEAHQDPRVRQFIRGDIEGPLTVMA